MKRMKTIFGTLLAICGLLGCACSSDDLALQVLIMTVTVLCFLIGGKLADATEPTE